MGFWFLQASKFSVGNKKILNVLFQYVKKIDKFPGLTYCFNVKKKLLNFPVFLQE